MSMVVHALYRYPVKSLGGELLPEARPLERGFADDRRWMLVNSDGKFITQRNHPGLACFRAEVVGEQALRIFRIDDPAEFVEIADARPRSEPDIRVTVWDDTFSAKLVPQQDNEIGKLLGIPDVRLVYMDEAVSRPVDPRYATEGETVSFADGYPYLITTTASLDDLSARHGEDLDVLRFRPNVVVRTDVPFAEDDWERLSIGDHQFRLPKPCARCIMVTHAPETGERDLSVLTHLSHYRKREGKVLFGVNALWSSGRGTIAVGDPVTLLG